MCIESILILDDPNPLLYYPDIYEYDHERGRCVFDVKWSKYDISDTGCCNMAGRKKKNSDGDS